MWDNVVLFGPKESYEEAFAPIKKFTSETPPYGWYSLEYLC